MDRNFYFYGNLFIGLGAFAGVTLGIMRLLVGPSVFGLDSFVMWFLVASLVSFAGSVFMLKYFHFKGYRFTFYSGLVTVCVQVCVVMLVFAVLLLRQYQSIYLPVVIFGLVAGLIYGISLVFSDAGSNRWLKYAGVVIVLISIAFGVAFVWGMGLPVEQNPVLQQVDLWSSLAGNVVSIFLIMQFSDEQKRLKRPAFESSLAGLRTAWPLMGIVAFIAMIALSIAFVREGLKSRYWQGQNTERERELIEKSEVRTFFNSDGDSLRYLLLKPLDYDPQKEYPLVVCLPYGGFQSPPAQLLSTNVNRVKYPAFLFVPYSPTGSSWGGAPNRRPMDELVYEAILSLDDAGIDEKRRYVSGVSLGGYGSWHFISTHPEMFAAAVPVCGEGDPASAPRIVDIPVWAFHGAKDRNVPVSGSREMIEALREAGGEPRYTEYPDLAHNIWYQVSETPGLLDWLFTQRRK